MTRKLLATVAMAIAATTWGFATQAAPVYVGTLIGAPGSGTPTTAGGFPVNGSGAYSVTSGGFFAQGTVTGTPPLTETQLLSTSTDVSTSTAGTLSIFVSEQNQFPYFQTPPTGPQVLSSFTTNLLTGNVVGVTESTYVSQCASTGCVAGDAYNLANMLSTASFAGSNQASALTNSIPNSLSQPFEFTEVYEVTFGSGGGTANLTIDLETIPEPASLALFGFGLLGAGIIRRRRRGAL